MVTGHHISSTDTQCYPQQSRAAINGDSITGLPFFMPKIGIDADYVPYRQQIVTVLYV